VGTGLNRGWATFAAFRHSLAVFWREFTIDCWGEMLFLDFSPRFVEFLVSFLDFHLRGGGRCFFSTFHRDLSSFGVFSRLSLWEEGGDAFSRLFTEICRVLVSFPDFHLRGGGDVLAFFPDPQANLMAFGCWGVADRSGYWVKSRLGHFCYFLALFSCVLPVVLCDQAAELFHGFWVCWGQPIEVGTGLNRGWATSCCFLALF